MRITNHMTYRNTKFNYQKSMNNLFNVNQQVASGMKIQHGYQDSSIFIDTMRLDYDLTTLKQTVESSAKAQTFANNSDKTLNQMTDIIAQMKVKLTKAANSGTNSNTSMEAIANDLKGLRRNLMDVANTSINGQFLFSGTATNRKPIEFDGSYDGNDEKMYAVTGAKIEIPYNISGKGLFLGRDGDYHKIIETNVIKYDQSITDKKVFIKEDSSMKKLVGDYEGNTVFYIQGRRPDGETFRDSFELTSDAKMKDLLKTIGERFGNVANNEVVDVSLNKTGQIVIKDERAGQNILDFSLVAATDKTAAYGAAGGANVTNPATLVTNTDMQITEFNKSNYKQVNGADVNPFRYDTASFHKDGKHVTADVPQVVLEDQTYATNATKLSEVAGKSLDGEEFTLQTVDVDGNPQTVTINLGAVSTFTVDPAGAATTYTIYGEEDGLGNATTTSADDMTYRQLNDIISMLTANELPATTANPDDYNAAINDARDKVEVNIDYRGRIDVVDMEHAVTKIEVGLYNSNAGDFTAGEESELTFSSNNALVIDEPNVDLFKDIDQMIKAVEYKMNHADSESEEILNIGIEAGIKRLDHLNDHIIKQHAKIGTISNTLKTSNERAELLTLNVSSIQSEIIDVDIGESLLKLKQYMMGYQAILQASSKINTLSLVNFI